MINYHKIRYQLEFCEYRQQFRRPVGAHAHKTRLLKTVHEDKPSSGKTQWLVNAIANQP